MAQAKIELKLGNVQFTGEAEAAWLEKQLDKLLEHAKGTESEDAAEYENGGLPPSRQQKAKTTLSAYLKSGSATTNQVKKFLGTACWLMSKGEKRITTGDVTKALSQNHQGKSGNPSDCLNQNVKRASVRRRAGNSMSPKRVSRHSARPRNRGPTPPMHFRRSPGA